MTLWFNGGFVEAGALIDAADRGFLLGDGVFETIYVENGRCAFLREHLRRLQAGLTAVRIAAPMVPGEVARVIAALAERNDLTRGRAAARLTVTRGPAPRGLQFGAPGAPTVMATLAPLAASPKAPLRLHVSSLPRFAGAATTRFKAIGGYVENLLAHNEAREAGADEAVMLNQEGRVACAAAANIFLIGAEAVVTPPVSEGALPGVVRGAILKKAREIGVPVKERAIMRQMLCDGDIFLTNSLIGVRKAVLASAPPPRKGGPARRKTLKALQSWYEERLKSELAKRRRT